ncbi:MAG TPA: histidine kinase [Burkholderiales bacterium]|nr:HAMP domain-containing protein [Betaproteobacteria bacterium]HQR52842.1 histidine kinase [Burkholderiales bacterium]
MSLKLRLNLVITIVLAIIFLASSVFLVREARRDVQAEIESTANLALHFLDAELQRARLAGDGPPLFHLAALGEVRHLTITLRDPNDRIVESNHPAARSATSAPRWFADLVAAMGPRITPIQRTVLVSGQSIGTLEVKPDPSFEVGEVWTYATGLMRLAGVIFVVTNVLIYWLVGRALAPVNKILSALNEIEHGNLATRMPPLDLPELARIAAAFNRMMDRLQSSVTQNRQLSQQLIRVQEEERRSLARELHDELGQCLTAILADGTAVLNSTRNNKPAPRESAEAVVAVTRHIMELVRGMLQRLHPETLDSLGLDDALQELVKGWRQRNPDVVCSLHIATPLDGLSDRLNITVYRVVQEALTNVARHARARHVEVCIRRSGTLEVEVKDDGAGMDTSAPVHGFGLAGMRERVEALGGSVRVWTQQARGVALTIELPLTAVARGV